MHLHEALEQFRDREFRYGTADCCLFVADVLRLTGGRDYAKPWRGKYRSLRGARRLAQKHGGVIGLATQAFGEMQPPLLARRGDPVLIGIGHVDLDGIDQALGICDGAGIVCLTDKGLIRLPLEAAAGCWHV